MAGTRPKLVVLLVLFTFILPTVLSGCSDFRAIFEGKPAYKVGKRRKKPAKRRNQPIPKKDKGYFSWPLFAPISSKYGPRRGRFHDGIDIDGDFGDPVRAAAAGQVVYSGTLGGYGKLVVIKHSNGYFTAYAHNRKNLVKKGKKVKKGQLIARVGSTGRSTGSHLHFEVRNKKGTYDPLAFLPDRRYSRK